MDSQNNLRPAENGSGDLGPELFFSGFAGPGCGGGLGGRGARGQGETDEQTISCEPNEITGKMAVGSEDNFLFDNSSVEKVWKSISDADGWSCGDIDFGNKNLLSILKTNTEGGASNFDQGNTSNLEMQENLLGKRSYHNYNNQHLTSNKTYGGYNYNSNNNTLKDRTNFNMLHNTNVKSSQNHLSPINQ